MVWCLLDLFKNLKNLKKEKNPIICNPWITKPNPHRRITTPFISSKISNSKSLRFGAVAPLHPPTPPRCRLFWRRRAASEAVSGRLHSSGSRSPASTSPSLSRWRASRRPRRCWRRRPGVAPLCRTRGMAMEAAERWRCRRIRGWNCGRMRCRWRTTMCRSNFLLRFVVSSDVYCFCCCLMGAPIRCFRSFAEN